MKDLVSFEVGEKLTIDDQVYIVLPDTQPVFSNRPYKQLGGSGEIRKLSLGKSKRYFALKVFDTPDEKRVQKDRALKAGRVHKIEGFEVADRKILTPRKNKELIRQFPPLKFAALMPWMPGFTWQEILAGQSEDNKYDLRSFLNRDSALYFASKLADSLAGLEEAGFAHCDLCSNNLILDPASRQVYLIDIDDMYGPKMERDEKFLGGQIGYRHPLLSRRAQWAKSSDRFSGAILINEVLTLFNPGLKRLSAKDSFFSQEQLQNSDSKAELFFSLVNQQIGAEGTELFTKVWESKNVSSCPTLRAWSKVLSKEVANREVDADQVELKYLLKPSSKKKIPSDGKKASQPSVEERRKIERPLVTHKHVELESVAGDADPLDPEDSLSETEPALPVDQFKPKNDPKIIRKWVVGIVMIFLLCSFASTLSGVIASAFVLEKPTAMTISSTTSSPTSTDPQASALYNCSLFAQNPARYHLLIRNTDRPNVASFGSSETEDILFHHSIENILGPDNYSYGVLDRVDADVTCYSSIESAISRFEREREQSEETVTIENLTSVNFGYMGQDKYRIFFIDQNIVVSLKGSSPYQTFPSSAITQTVRQAQSTLINIRKLPELFQ